MKRITKIILLSSVPIIMFAGMNNDMAWLKGKTEGQYIKNSEGSKATANASSLCEQSFKYASEKVLGYKNDYMRGCLKGIRGY